MAKRSPTNNEKAVLQADPRFRQETQWAVFTLANYWKNQSGANLNAADALRWRKHQYYSNGIILSPETIDNEISSWASQFAIASGNFQIVEDTITEPEQFVVNDVIEYMLAQNHFEAIANVVFEQRLAQAI